MKKNSCDGKSTKKSNPQPIKRIAKSAFFITVAGNGLGIFNLGVL